MPRTSWWVFPIRSRRSRRSPECRYGLLPGLALDRLAHLVPRKGDGVVQVSGPRLNVVRHSDDADGEQGQEASLHRLAGKRGDLEDLTRGQHTVGAGQHEGVSGAQGHTFESGPRVVDRGTGAVEVTKGLANGRRIRPGRRLLPG